MSESTIYVAIAYHSGYGHTTKQAEAVARGAAAVPATHVDLVNVDALSDAQWATLDRADAIIFGAPTYMGSPSAGLKPLPKPPQSDGRITCAGRTNWLPASPTRKA